MLARLANLTKKLPGLGDHGSGKRFALASAVYISLLSCTALVLLGTLVDSSDDQSDVAAGTPVATETPEPPASTATPEPERGMPLVTDAGSIYVEDARLFLNELDDHVAAVESGNLTDPQWSQWSSEWNEHRDHRYQDCQATDDTGLLACVPLYEVRHVWSAEHSRLWNGGSQTDVDDARTQVAETFSEIEGF